MDQLNCVCNLSLVFTGNRIMYSTLFIEINTPMFADYEQDGEEKWGNFVRQDKIIISPNNSNCDTT